MHIASSHLTGFLNGQLLDNSVSKLPARIARPFSTPLRVIKSISTAAAISGQTGIRQCRNSS